MCKTDENGAYSYSGSGCSGAWPCMHSLFYSAFYKWIWGKQLENLWHSLSFTLFKSSKIQRRLRSGGGGYLHEASLKVMIVLEAQSFRPFLTYGPILHPLDPLLILDSVHVGIKTCPDGCVHYYHSITKLLHFLIFMQLLSVQHTRGWDFKWSSGDI